MTIGYLRVSTGKQHPANQQDEIRRFAQSRGMTIDRWVTEVASGKKKESDRRLGTLLRRMKRGDTLVVTEVSRLSRTLTEIMSIMGTCLRKGIRLYTKKEKYSFDDSINSKVLCFAFGLVAEIEHSLINRRLMSRTRVKRLCGTCPGCRRPSTERSKTAPLPCGSTLPFSGRSERPGRILLRNPQIGRAHV